MAVQLILKKMGVWCYCYVESWLAIVSNTVYSIQRVALNYNMGYTVIGLIAAFASLSSNKVASASQCPSFSIIVMVNNLELKKNKLLILLYGVFSANLPKIAEQHKRPALSARAT